MGGTTHADTTTGIGGDIPAELVPVEVFRQILVWPLSVDRRDAAEHGADGLGPRVTSERVESAFADTVAALLDAQTQAEASGAAPNWRLIEDPLAAPDRLAGLDDAALYAEFVYFHEFAQVLLFGKVDRGAIAAGNFADLSFVRFRNRGLAAVEIEWERVLGRDVKCPRPLITHKVRLDVERCDLVLLRDGLAFLMLEVACPAARAVGLTLADVQDLVDRFRRAFPPYFEVAEADVYDRVPGDRECLPAGRAARVPSGVRWIPRKGEAGAKLAPTGLAHDFGTLSKTRNPVVAPHWIELLPLPLTGQTEGPSVPSVLAGADRPRWKAFADERMPTMVSVQLPSKWQDDPATAEAAPACDMMKALERGDFVRLCFCDDRGPGHPYDEGFLANFEKDQCYRRFESWGTLYMMTEYSFVHVLCSTFTESLTHMRTMYCDMFLLAHIELAIHLSLSNRISVAIRRRDLRRAQAGPEADRQFQEEVIAIERGFLDAEQRFRFTGVTNQLQGGELFSMLRQKMRLDELYDEMREELSTATGFILSANADRQADSAGRLNVFAVIGLVLGLAFSFLGMNTVMSESFWNNIGNSGTGGPPALFTHPSLHLALFCITLATFAAAAFGLIWWLVPKRDIDASQSLPKLMRLLWIGASVSAVTSALVWWRLPQHLIAILCGLGGP